METRFIHGAMKRMLWCRIEDSFLVYVIGKGFKTCYQGCDAGWLEGVLGWLTKPFTLKTDDNNAVLSTGDKASVAVSNT